MFHIHLLKKISFVLVLLVIFSTCVFAIDLHKKIELECIPMAIVLPDGRVIKKVVATGDGQVYLPYQLVEDITKKEVTLDQERQLINIGHNPFASIMSDTLKIQHYDYNNIHSFLYYPNVKTNKTMTMNHIVHESGYALTNVDDVCFNLNGQYRTINGLLGCDDCNASSGEVSFYLDGNLLETYTLTTNEPPAKIDLCVKGGSELKVVFSHFAPNTQINLADMYIH